MSDFLSKIISFRKASRRDNKVKSFKEGQEREKAFDFRNRGQRSVALRQIVGSVGRYNDFDRRFRLKHHVPSDRLESVKKAMRAGRTLPPVKLYQIKDEYFVLDGNHRIAAAKELGRRHIEADIVEFIPSRDTLENLLYRERSEFCEKTGLSASIRLTEVGQYAHLVEQIGNHRDYLEETCGQAVTLPHAARDWHQTIFSPLAAIISKSGLARSFSQRTIDDLYVYISIHQWQKGRRRRYGIGIDRLIPKEMEEFRKKMAEMECVEYPEMKRGLTAFVLMKVKAKSETRIMEKLFALESVREIHSIHGEYDLIVKFVLTRDLLSSDAEVISEFVGQHIRGLSGVSSTETLIPGISKIKEPRS